MRLEHLTPAELDTLLEAARAATRGPWQTRFIHRLFQSARRDPDLSMYTAPDQDWPDSEFIALANPATIERLVLMVGELQRDNEKWQRAAGYWKAQHESEDNSHRLTIATFRRQEKIWQQKNLEADIAVEHFRARAVRAIDKLDTQLPEGPFHHGYQAGAVAARSLIESLPLVETEEE